MTTDTAAGPAQQDEAPAGPQLIHAGTYALYRTPSGGYHVVYQRSTAADETGTVRPVEGAPPQHLRELPEKAAVLVASILDRDTPVPPIVQAILDGKRPGLRELRELTRLRDEAEAAMSTGDDG